MQCVNDQFALQPPFVSSEKHHHYCINYTGFAMVYSHGKCIESLNEHKYSFFLDFRLVIICCKEDEVSSLLVGDLREYKQNPPPLPTMKSAQEYLRNHFAEDALKASEDWHIFGTSISVDPIANQ